MNNKQLHTTKTGKKIIAVADAMAMNAAPEYWMSIKSAGMHLLSLCIIAKQFFIQH